MRCTRFATALLLALPAFAAQATPGALDTAFNGSGRMFRLQDAGAHTTIYATTTQADNKILLAGSTYDGLFAVERLNADGSLDTTFAGTGLARVTTNLYGDSVRTARAIVVQPDGRIVVAGDVYSTYNGRNYSAAAFRLNANGSIDTSFATTTGDHVMQFSSVQDNPVMRFNAVALQPDGRIVLAGEGSDGTMHTSPPSKFLVARLNTNGSFDTSFAGWGETMVSVIVRDVERSAANALVLQPDGKIVVAGEAQGSDGDYDFGFIRVNANGLLDSSFGYYGQYTVAFDLGGAGVDKATGVVLQPNGKIVATGTVDGPSGTHTLVGLTRLTSAGALDTTFAGAGHAATPFVVERAVNDASGAGIVQGTDGTLWVAGTFGVPSSNGGSSARFGWLRYDANGNVLGRGTIDPCDGACTGYGSAASALARDAAGRLAIAGTGLWYYPPFGPVFPMPAALRLLMQ